MAPDAVYEEVGGFRWVRPYRHVYRTHCKQRWAGQGLVATLDSNFHFDNRSKEANRAYVERAVADGRISVNDKRARADHVLKMSDVIVHAVHQHEPPVPFCGAEDMVVEVMPGRGLVLANKPAGTPVHKTGSYHRNNLLSILKHAGFGGADGKLDAVHRIDRLVSGLVLLATTREASRRFFSLLEQHSVRKVYVAKVRGRFPSSTDAPLPDAVRPHCSWPARAAAPGAASGEGAGPATSGPGAAGPLLRVDLPLRRASGGGNLHEAVYAAAGGADPPRKRPRTAAGGGGGAAERGAGAVRAAVTGFRRLCYIAEEDASIVAAYPETGRQHQIRVHLQSLGHSIVDDEDYGGTVRRRRPPPQQPLPAERAPGAAGGEGAEGTAGAAAAEEAEERGGQREQEEQEERRLAAACEVCKAGGDLRILYNERQIAGPYISLHALRYESKGGQEGGQEGGQGDGPGGGGAGAFRFEVPLPPWAEGHAILPHHI